HCPRSNHAHGHGAAPFPAMRAAGLRVGLGTDSAVSVGDVDLLAEARAAGLNGEAALLVLTLEAARALGLENEIGSLQVGKQADLALFPFSPAYRPLPSASAPTWSSSSPRCSSLWTGWGRCSWSRRRRAERRRWVSRSTGRAGRRSSGRSRVTTRCW